MKWLQVIESIATMGIFLYAVLIGVRDRPATVNVVKDKDGKHKLIILTKKGKIFSQHGGPHLPADLDADEYRDNYIIGQWDLMHSLHT